LNCIGWERENCAVVAVVRKSAVEKRRNLVKASVEFKKKCRKEGMNEFGEGIREMKKKCRKEGMNLVKASE
jgi:flagellar motor component MotA